AVNLVLFLAFLCWITGLFGFRSTVATVLLLATVIVVVSLRFEMRHVFYLYTFPVIAWGGVLWWLFARYVSLAGMVFDRFYGVPIDTNELRIWRKRAVLPALSVSALLLVPFAAAYATLAVARTYQAHVLTSLIADWQKRQRVPVEVDTSETRAGVSLLRLRSPFPVSTGGERSPGEAV